jgi:hypothetical protein
VLLDAGSHHHRKLGGGALDVEDVDERLAVADGLSVPALTTTTRLGSIAVVLMVRRLLSR